MEHQADVALEKPAAYTLQPQGRGAAEGCAEPPTHGRIEEAGSPCGVQEQDRNVGGGIEGEIDKLGEFCKQIDEGLSKEREESGNKVQHFRHRKYAGNSAGH